VEREDLQRYLNAGMSLEAIGREVNRHPTTVAYWLRKHGLQAVHRERHCGRGGIPRETLELLIGEGLSIAAIAKRLGFGETSVKHWLAKYGLRTARGARHAAGRAAKAAGHEVAQLICARHGLTDFRLEGRGAYRCLTCRAERVAARRRKVKEILVSEAGGMCRMCGYDRSVGALHFHHVDPAGKRFAISRDGFTRSLDEAREEARKCVLLCANCHAEVEAGIVEIALGGPTDNRSGVAQSGRAFGC
jgi:hypothetical protein